MARKPLNWQRGYVNPAMSPAVVRALAEAGYAPDGSRLSDMVDGIGTAFNRVLNPIRRAVGAEEGELPPGVEPMDYGGLLGGYDAAMAAMGGADPARRNRALPAETMPMKDQSRVMPSRGAEDMPPAPVQSMALHRQLSGDIPPAPYNYMDEAKIRMDQWRRENFPPEAVTDAPAHERQFPSGIGMAFNPVLPEPMASPAIPRPTARPRPASYVIKAGDNPSKIARMFGMSLSELEAKNPGILKRARKLRPGVTVKI